MEELCIFKTRYDEDCADKLPCSTNRGSARIQSTINASKTYSNSLFSEPEHQFELNPNLSVKYHKTVCRGTLLKRTSQRFSETYTRKRMTQLLQRNGYVDLQHSLNSNATVTTFVKQLKMRDTQKDGDLHTCADLQNLNKVVNHSNYICLKRRCEWPDTRRPE